jgi:hypothetical protein
MNNNGGDATTGGKADAGKVVQQKKGFKRNSARRPQTYSAYQCGLI